MKKFEPRNVFRSTPQVVGFPFMEVPGQIRPQQYKQMVIFFK